MKTIIGSLILIITLALLFHIFYTATTTVVNFFQGKPEKTHNPPPKHATINMGTRKPSDKRITVIPLKILGGIDSVYIIGGRASVVNDTLIILDWEEK